MKEKKNNTKILIKFICIFLENDSTNVYYFVGPMAVPIETETNVNELKLKILFAFKAFIYICLNEEEKKNV